MAQDKPRVNIRFLYNYCSDLAAMRHFYTDILGLKEVGFSEEQRYLCYQSEGFQFIFFLAEGDVPATKEWADQPGHARGTAPITSWSVAVPESDFAATVERLRGAGVETLTATPEWYMDSYWGFVVKDPMGLTVEVYTIPKERPATTTWPAE